MNTRTLPKVPSAREEPSLMEWLLSMPPEDQDRMRDILTKMSRREEKEARLDQDSHARQRLTDT